MSKLLINNLVIPDFAFILEKYSGFKGDQHNASKGTWKLHCFKYMFRKSYTCIDIL